MIQEKSTIINMWNNCPYLKKNSKIITIIAFLLLLFLAGMGHNRTPVFLSFLSENSLDRRVFPI